MNGISRRLEEQHQKSALNLWMTEETTRYMFRLIAAKMMFEDPAAFGFSVSERYPYYPPKEVVEVNTPIQSLVSFAEEHGISYLALKEANLWLRSDKLTNKNAKTYRIVIPASGR